MNPKTIRYYETVGVLPPPHRGENRYRRYSKEAVELLQFIKKAQGLGFTLSEIKEVVDLRRSGHAPCVHVRVLVERKIADLDQQVTDLVALRKKLMRNDARSGLMGPSGPTLSSRQFGYDIGQVAAFRRSVGGKVSPCQ